MPSKFKNVVSLGFFCSVSLELEKIGVRKASYPFDWVISSNFELVCRLIKNKFDSFMEYENLSQEYKVNPNYYFDEKYQIHFYHDFTSDTSLEMQYEREFNKYKRRIDRFFNDIQNPTLFIRYVSSSSEIEYIKENITQINNLIKGYNKSNEIVYITNYPFDLKDNRVFFVESDNNDTVARKFLNKSPQIKEFILSSFDISKKDM